MSVGSSQRRRIAKAQGRLMNAHDRERVQKVIDHFERVRAEEVRAAKLRRIVKVGALALAIAVAIAAVAA